MPGFSPKRRRRGFTLSEVLIAVAVLAILAGLAVPNVIHYQRLLNMQALDQSAQEIFLAAQSRMTTLKNAGTLSQVAGTALASGAADTEYLTERNIDELMPDLSLESRLMENHFYVVYDAAGGSVLTVLYGEETFSYADGTRAVGMSVEERMGQDLWVGYYTGSAAGSGTFVKLDRPVIGFINGEKLQAEITVKRPDNTVSWQSITPEAYIGEKKLDVSFANYRAVNSNTIKYTITLDSLDPSEKQFKDLDTDVEPGQDFYLTVKLSCSADNVVGSSATSASTVNSLFDKVDGESAYISCGRHLQNLDDTTSGVESVIQKAVQTADITFSDTESATDWYTYYTEENVSYTPIANYRLKSYDGGSRTITGLRAKADVAGMFVFFGGTLQNIYLVNPEIIGTRLAGGLAAYNQGALAINNCRVYHAYPGSTPKKELKGYPIQSGYVAGGLVGQIYGALTISNSFAATLISGEQSVGGLLGGGGGAIHITNSYADCYLSTAGQAGGLAGTVDSDSAVAVNYCYSAGFIVEADTAAGLMCGRADVYSSYSAMTHLAEVEDIYPLVIDGTASSSYYLPALGAQNAIGQQVSVSELKNNKTLIGWFDRATAGTTYAYNLADSMALRVYPFPKVKGLPHYGDWRAEFESGALVYYEMYQDGSYGFSGGGKNYLRTDADDYVTQDGYAVAYADKAPTGVATATCGGKNISVASTAIKVTVTADGASGDYYLLPLSIAELNAVPPTQDFYQKITVTVGGVPMQYWFNPHFAATAVEGAGEAAPAAPDIVYLRSPRQLNALSRCSDTYAPRGWRFVQEMTLDYNTYAWAAVGLTRPVSQGPIGTAPARAFSGFYDGGEHVIRGISVAGGGDDIGLFGCNSGTIQDVIFDSATTVGRTGKISGRGDTVTVGALVGRNSGSVIRCAAAWLKVGATNAQNSTVYVGGLVGCNDGGLIRQCAAAVGTIEVSSIMANAYVGGFVGMDAGSISRSTAHGAVRASRDTSGSVYVAGFAGAGTGSITDSYCAVGIYADGNPTVSSFCTSARTGSGNYYLNDGNYVFEGNSYTLSYGKNDGTDAGGARGLKQLALAQKVIPGMTNMVKPADGQVDDKTANPYPRALSRHYGGWLKQLDLGDIGVAYWEKEEKNGNSEYRFSFKGLTLSSTGAVLGQTGESLLCGYHNDGGIITEYGYAYYYRGDDDHEVEIANGSQIFTKNNVWNSATAVNEPAGAALSIQMEGRYTFVAYDVYDAAKKEGLCTVNTNQNGLWPLSYKNETYNYRISPFFADCIEYSSTTDGLGKKDNPYKVRSIKQLQYINWNYALKNYSTESQGLPGKYPYLANSLVKWEQGHDIRAVGEINYTPIGSMSAKFQGTYDGKDYKIEDISFTSGTRFVGLFGVTYGADLRNIVMCSSDGKAVIRGTTNANSYSGVGGIVGAALWNKGNGAVSNCTISGYAVINDVTVLSADTTLPNHTYGAAVGGLVGWSSVKLTNCTAVTDVSGGGAVSSVKGINPNSSSTMRLGGLVGSAYCTITNCYAGGSVVDQSNAKVITSYMGGLVGSGHNPNIQEGTGNTTLTLKHCYSYVELTSARPDSLTTTSVVPVAPKTSTNRTPGTIETDSIVTNCYYMKDRIKITTLSNDLGTALSYDQFCDNTTGDGLLGRLKSGGGTSFGTVTTKDENDTPIDGKYTIPSASELKGLNYPFPTILTQAMSYDDDGTVDQYANLHYGDWPRQGLFGSRVVELDLVATDAAGKRVNTAVVPYTPGGVAPGGTYSVVPPTGGETFDATVATAVIDPTGGQLTVTGLRVGFTTTAVRYTVDGKSYDLNVEIVVTAQVNVVPTPASAAALVDGQQSFTCKAYDKNGHPLDVMWTSAVSNAPLIADTDSEKASIDATGVFTAYTLAAGDAIFTANAVWIDPLTKAPYAGAGRASLSVLTPAVTAQNVTVALGKGYAYPAGGISVRAGDAAATDVTITAVAVADPAVATAAVKDGVLSFTGVKAAATTAKISFTYRYGGFAYSGDATVTVTVIETGFVPREQTLLMRQGTEEKLYITMHNPPTGTTYRVMGVDTKLIPSASYDQGALTVTAAPDAEGKTDVTIQAMANGAVLDEAVVHITVFDPPQLELKFDPTETALAAESTLSLPLAVETANGKISAVTVTGVEAEDDDLVTATLGAGQTLVLEAGNKTGTEKLELSVDYRFDYTVEGSTLFVSQRASAPLTVTVERETWTAAFTGEEKDVKRASASIFWPNTKTRIEISNGPGNNSRDWTGF